MSEGKTFILPEQIVSPADVSRIWRELTTLEDFLEQAKIRQGGQPVSVPSVSAKLDKLCQENGVNLLHEAQRTVVKQYIAFLKDNAPSSHISFATAASPAAVGRILTWLRTEIHPQMLVTIGLSPAIVAGCIVRTPNRQFDFSLQHRLESKKSLLFDAIAAMGKEVAA